VNGNQLFLLNPFTVDSHQPPFKNVYKINQRIPELFAIVDMVGFQFFAMAIPRVFQTVP
jgi:hypothetical protein